ncbi:MAG: LacI family DNA-binding transcriptional regulator [Acidobacteriaceae bacterium]
MRTVALRAGVSSATVSRVINGSPSVKKETAEHVQRVIDELNFIPNPVATTLKYGRSKTYGLIVPDLTNPFYPEFLLTFENLLVENDHEVLLATTQTTHVSLTHSVRRMLMRRVDGVVLMASEFDTHSIEPLLDHRIPIVTIDRRRAGKGYADVAIDFETGYQQAVLHLKELGHRRIAFIGGNEGRHTSQVRLEAFQQALQGAGLHFDPKLTRAGDYRVEGGDAAMRSLLATSNRPTAVLTANDLTAFGVLRALYAYGLSAPTQMSVVGFDGLMLSDAIQPALTTVAVSRRELVESCLKALDKLKMDVSKRGSLLSVSSALLIRESTAPPPA